MTRSLHRYRQVHEPDACPALRVSKHDARPGHRAESVHVCTCAPLDAKHGALAPLSTKHVKCTRRFVRVWRLIRSHITFSADELELNSDLGAKRDGKHVRGVRN